MIKLLLYGQSLSHARPGLLVERTRKLRDRIPARLQRAGRPESRAALVCTARRAPCVFTLPADVVPEARRPGAQHRRVRCIRRGNRVAFKCTSRSPCHSRTSPGFKVHMQLTSHGLLDRPRIVIADEDPSVVRFVIKTLREDGNAVFHAYDALSAVQLAYSLDRCDLLISNTRVEGLPGIELIHTLRQSLPNLAIMYMANIGRSSPEIEARLPPGVPILREPFTAEELRAAVRPYLPVSES